MLYVEHTLLKILAFSPFVLFFCFGEIAQVEEPLFLNFHSTLL